MLSETWGGGGEERDKREQRSCSISSTGELLKALDPTPACPHQAGLVCMGAHFLWVISRGGKLSLPLCVRVCARVCVRVCVCARLGEVWGCFVCEGRKGMPNQTQ